MIKFVDNGTVETEHDETVPPATYVQITIGRAVLELEGRVQVLLQGRRNMTEDSPSREASTVKRRDVLRATGIAAAGGALSVGATGSAAAWSCPDKCVEFTSFSGSWKNNVRVTKVDDDTVKVCSKAKCALTVFIKASTAVDKTTLRAANENTGVRCTTIDNPTGGRHDISNVTVCPPGDAPGYVKNGNNSNGNGKGKGNGKN